jgi:Raf kinase inhibitor-like YbhB/YbcL family protein
MNACRLQDPFLRMNRRRRRSLVGTFIASIDATRRNQGRGSPVMERHQSRCYHTAISVLPLIAATGCIGTAFAQPNRVTDVEIVGHVYEPKRLRASDAQLRELQVPRGFHIHRFAEGLNNPRMLEVADDGTVYVTQREPGNLVMLRDLDDDGVIDTQRVVLEIPQLHGVELDGETLWLVDVKRLHRARLGPDGAPTALETLIEDLPDGGQHPNRTIAMGPDGNLYLSVGSTCNACRETNSEHATLLQINPVTLERKIFATGLRNTIGFDWHPVTDRLYGMDHNVDWKGDDRPPEELNEIIEGKNYGWPFIFSDRQVNPQDDPVGVTLAELLAQNTPPVGKQTAHSAPMQLAFYSAGQFPTEYRNNAFYASRGSWNRKPPSGYDIQRVIFTPNGEFQRFSTFVSGFVEEFANGGHGYIGRPTGIAVANDGSLLIGDDMNNMVYRVVYGAGEPPAAAPQELAGRIFATAPADIRVASSSLEDEGFIPERHTDYGDGISPALSWTNAPAETKSVVLLMEDPRATAPLPFVHWVAINLPPKGTLPEGAGAAELMLGAIHGSNSRTEDRYFGPRPPEGDAPHPYHIQIFALDTTLDLPPGFNRHTLLNAMREHVLARGHIVAHYGKSTPK